jgi:hypothetical protein
MARPQMIPISQFSGVLSRRRALYQGSLPTDKSRPISRQSQESKYGKSTRTLQKYSQGVRVEENFRYTPEATKTASEFITKPQLPNTYYSHYFETKRGMLRRVYGSLKPLSDEGRDNNRERLYFPRRRAYLHSKHGSASYILLTPSPLPGKKCWEYVYV